MAALQVIQTLTAGVENFLPHVPDGVTLCNAAGVHDASTAELAVALTLASGRHLDDFARHAARRPLGAEFGRALADQRVLIVGYGNIGAAIERRLAGFEVASVTRVARRARERRRRRCTPIDELDALLPDADVVIVIAPHTPETEGLIGADRLALLPDDALLVNVARGRLVDTDALRGRDRRAAGSGPRWTSPTPSRCRPSTRCGVRPGVLISPARRRRQLGVLPARRPPDRRPAAPLRRRRRTGEHRSHDPARAARR